MSTDLNEQIRDLMERGLRPVTMADIQNRAPVRVTTLRRAAARSRLSHRRLILAGAAIAACAALAVAGLTIALLPGGTPAGRGKVSVVQGPTMPPNESRHDLPSAAAVGKAMLAAFSAANDDILYQAETDSSRDGATQVYQDWYWPAHPVPGQAQRWRDARSQRNSPAAPLKLAEDTEFSYITPPPSKYGQRVDGQITDVCYPGVGQPSCGFFGWLEHPAGTWLVYRGRFPYMVPLTADLSPAAVARQIAKGQWRVTGRTHLRGQPVIELTQTPGGEWQGRTVLWVNARTHLPVQMIEREGKRGWTQDNWSYLRPTHANQALLRVPIPKGYQRSGPTRG
jgi:hypothetical protein